MTRQELAKWSFDMMMNGYIITNDDLFSRPLGASFWCKNGDCGVSWYLNSSDYIRNYPGNRRTLEQWTAFVEQEMTDTSLRIMDVPDALVQYFRNAPMAEPDYDYLFGG